MLSPKISATFSAPDKLFPDHKRLRQPVRLGLNGIVKRAAKPPAVAQQLFKLRQVMGRGNDENFANARQHQDTERVVDHRLVVDRHELLADGQRQRMQPCPGAARENNTLHGGSIPQRPVQISALTPGKPCAIVAQMPEENPMPDAEPPRPLPRRPASHARRPPALRVAPASRFWMLSGWLPSPRWRWSCLPKRPSFQSF